MSAIADFISGTVNESLKKLLQPVGLIPAAVFVLLNLAFIYPAARADGVRPALAFAALDAPAQAAVAGFLTLALGYVILSASGTILDILGGQLIRGSVVHSALVWLQRRRRERLMSVKPPNPWYVAKRFYLPRDEEEQVEPLPSALGNVLVATQGRVERRYGFDMAALWSQLVATPELKEVPARGVVEDERAARDTLGNTAFVLWLFALEGLVFFTFRDEPRHALASLIAVPTGYIVYRFAVAKAHAWGSAVETLLDLHRHKLHESLKLASYGSLSAERQVWAGAARFFVTATEEASGDDVFQTTDAPSVTAIPAGDLTIPEPLSAVVDGRADVANGIWLRWVEYVLLIAKKSRAAPAPTAEVVVDDPRIARIEWTATAEELGTPPPQVVRGSGDKEQLLWTLRELPPGGVVSLRYKLPLFALRWEPATGADGAPLKPEVNYLPGVGFAVDVPKDVEAIRVMCFGTGPSRPEIRRADTPCRPTSSDGRSYAWHGLAGKSVWVLLPNEAA